MCCSQNVVHLYGQWRRLLFNCCQIERICCSARPGGFKHCKSQAVFCSCKSVGPRVVRWAHPTTPSHIIRVFACQSISKIEMSAHVTLGLPSLVPEPDQGSCRAARPEFVACAELALNKGITAPLPHSSFHKTLALESVLHCLTA
jgi:hypothetical protein